MNFTENTEEMRRKRSQRLIDVIVLLLLSVVPIRAQTFPVGKQPWVTVFDGTNIWISNRGDNTVSKLSLSDGAILATYPVGSAPTGIVFDGANIWAANLNSNNVTKLRASDGAWLGTFAVGTQPHELVFDGANI